MHRDAAISICYILVSLFIICFSRNQAAILTHYILDLNLVAAVQLDQGPINASQLKMQVIGSVLGQDRVDGFVRRDLGTPSGVCVL